MSIKNLISSRNNNGNEAVITQEEHTSSSIICDDEGLKRFVNNWCSQEFCRFQDFAHLLEEVGISLPVKLDKFSVAKQGFLCTDSSGKEYTISLDTGVYSVYSHLSLTEKLENTTITRNYFTRFGKDREQIMVLHSRVIETTVERDDSSETAVEKTKIEISSSFDRYSCEYSVTINNDYKLEIEINDEQIDETWVSEHNDAMEEYLLNYKYEKFDIDAIYAKIIEILERETSKIELLGITYWKYARCLAKVFVVHGVTEKYGYVTPSEKSFCVTRKGNWSYSTDNVLISYEKATNKLKYTVELDDEKASKVDMVRIIEAVKVRISEMWSKVGL